MQENNFRIARKLRANIRGTGARSGRVDKGGLLLRSGRYRPWKTSEILDAKLDLKMGFRVKMTLFWCILRIF